MERRIEIRPAFDRRHTDPNKNYGIHNAELCFFLIGPEGAIQFIVSTGWHLPHVMKEMEDRGHLSICKGWATDIGYHSYAPRYEGQESISDDCPLLGGKPCYYDGSTLNAEPIFNKLVSEGHEAVWTAMQEWYDEHLLAVKEVSP